MSIFIFILKVFGHVYKHSLKLQIQLATCQWILIVELCQFHNRYNAELISGQGFCCCDAKEEDYDEKCNVHVTDLPQCPAKCDTVFNISVHPCLSTHSCSVATATHCNSASIPNLDYTFVLILESLPSKVSFVNKPYIQ